MRTMGALIFTAALVIMLASLAGRLLVWRSTGVLLQRNIHYLITFSIGVFVMIAYNLFGESLESGGTALSVLVAAALGALALALAGWFLPNAHHHHDIHHEHSHTRTDARRLMMSDALHNIIDGLLLVPAFLIDVRIGIMTTAAVFLHEVVQGISEFFVLLDAGLSVRRALLVNFLVNGTILIGVGVGLVLANAPELHVPLSAMSAFAAGALLFVVFRDLLPNTIACAAREGEVRMHITAALLGVLTMFGVTLIDPPHEHHTVPTPSAAAAHTSVPVLTDTPA